MSRNTVIIRAANEDDYAFIMDSWLNSHAESRIFSPIIQRELYFKLHRPLVEAILHRPTTLSHIAANGEDPSLIYGYAIFEKLKDLNIFHYIYVKRAFNGFGISNILLKSAPFPIEGAFITHLTKKGQYVFGKYNFNYCFYLLYPVENKT